MGDFLFAPIIITSCFLWIFPFSRLRQRAHDKWVRSAYDAHFSVEPDHTSNFIRGQCLLCSCSGLLILISVRYYMSCREFYLLFFLKEWIQYWDHIYFHFNFSANWTQAKVWLIFFSDWFYKIAILEINVFIFFVHPNCFNDFSPKRCYFHFFNSILFFPYELFMQHIKQIHPALL